MAFRYAEKLDQPVNVEKAVKMALIHDLAEAKVGDIPVFVQNREVKKLKYENEENAMREFRDELMDVQAREMYDLWMEYEKQENAESKFVKALDKLEAFIQHAEANYATWEEREKRMVFQNKWLKQFCEYDSFLNRLCDATLQKCLQKMITAGDNVAAIMQAAKEEERAWETDLIAEASQP
jgi:putative hydrolase of HD superfamily